MPPSIRYIPVLVAHSRSLQIPAILQRKSPVSYYHLWLHYGNCGVAFSLAGAAALARACLPVLKKKVAGPGGLLILMDPKSVRKPRHGLA